MKQIVVLLILALPFTINAQGIKCWTNNDGMMQCGDVIPEEYTQQEHQKYNEQATVIGTQNRAKTKEEIAEERRIEREKKEAEERAHKKRVEDQKLLDLYSSEEDIETTLRATLSNVDASIERFEMFIQQAEKNLDALENSLNVDSSRHLNEKQRTEIEQDIRSVKRNISSNRMTLEAKKNEKAGIERKFKSDLERYRSIMAEREAERAASEGGS